MSDTAISPDRSLLSKILVSWFAPLLLAGALLALFVSAFITHRNVIATSESALWVAHTSQVLARTEGILADLNEAESAARGFLISNNAEFREQFEVAQASTIAKQEELEKLTLDNTDQQKQVEELTNKVRIKLELMGGFVASRERPASELIEMQRSITEGTRQMIAVRTIVREIQNTEDELLARRIAQMNYQISLTKLTLLLSSLVSACVVLSCFYLLRRHWDLEHLVTTKSRRHLIEKEELARYNERVLESTGEGIYGIDVDGKCTFINRAGALTLGGQPKDFLQKEMHELVHHTKESGEQFPVKECPIYKATQTGDGCRVDDEIFWRLDGKSVPIEYSSFPLMNGDQVDGAVITFNDITARIRSRKELQLAKETAEAANESKSQFLANMSHELRTPLNAVIMYSELLAEEAVDQNVPDFIPDLKRIRSAGKHLLELVNGVLDLSKVEAGKMELYPEPIDVAKMVHEIAKTLEPIIEKNRNKLKVSIASDVDTMIGDLTKLRQVLYNLLSNASKFTQDGIIELRVSRSGDDALMVFEVIDSGIGMTEEQVQRLFQPFMQADASTTRKYGGTGLGLAIIKRFTELMRGNVIVKSVPGSGTTFTVSVPEKLEQPVDELSSNPVSNDMNTKYSNAIQSLDSKANLVLIIDDDVSVRDTLTRVLLAEGIRPMTAPDGAEGLKRAHEFHPDLIILDVTMPRLDGWTVLAALKADDELCDIPVIMHSVRDDPDLGFMLGASEYLVKPVDRGKLVKTLRRHMQADNASILIIDDDEATRRAVRRSLEEEGWKVAEAANGIEGLAELNRQLPAVILLDLMMPEMDGFEFLEEMHKNPEWKKLIHIVVLTSRDLSPEDLHRLNGGVDKVLAKGTLSRHHFLDEVRRIVNSLTRHLPTPVDVHRNS